MGNAVQSSHYVHRPFFQGLCGKGGLKTNIDAESRALWR